MRVLVLGGTWFLGRRIVELLSQRGDEVLCIHRGPRDEWSRSGIYTPTVQRWPHIPPGYGISPPMR